MKKGILTALFGIFVFIYYLVLTIQSFNYSSDEYGKDLSVNNDYLTLCLLGLVIIICAIIVLIKIENDQETFGTYNTSINLIGFVLVCYNLGMMFKMINKLVKETKPEKIPGLKASTVDYLIWAIFGAFILAYGVISYIEHKKKIA